MRFRRLSDEKRLRNIANNRRPRTVNTTAAETEVVVADPVDQVAVDLPFRFEGRRIVELGYLAEQLVKGCFTCNAELRLFDTVAERRYGLGVILSIRCCFCGCLNAVHTGKRHHDATKKRTMPIFDMNTKAAAGKLYETFIINLCM